MADYRDISQEYARQGINAGILLNGGAAVALLSQVGSLNEQHLTEAIRWPMSIWAAGAALAASTWVIAFVSARFVDKSEREAAAEARHLRISDAWMYAGVVFVVLSYISFAAGCIKLAKAF